MIRCRCCDEPAEPNLDATVGKGRDATRFPLCRLCHGFVLETLKAIRALPEASAKDRMVRG